MECTFGITGKGFSIIATDKSKCWSIIKLKSDVDKQKVIGDSLILGYSGEPGDTDNFIDYVEANLVLDQFRHENELQPAPAASWIRRQLANSIRSRHPYAVNIVLGGFDKPSGQPELYLLDYLGTMCKVPYTAQGHAAFFSMGIFDRWHHPDMNLEQGLELLRKCISELETRYLVNLGDFTVRVVDENGVRLIDLPKSRPAGDTSTQASSSSTIPVPVSS